jgi:predicted nucleic acid-binding protein
VPLRLIDSSIWIAYLRPKPGTQLAAAVQEALLAGEAAVAAPIIAEVLAGIRDASEYGVRQADFRALAHIGIDGDVGYTAARIGRALADQGKTGKTIDLLIAAGALHAGAELWSLPNDHYENIRRIVSSRELRGIGMLEVRWFA